MFKRIFPFSSKKIYDALHSEAPLVPLPQEPITESLWMDESHKG